MSAICDDYVLVISSDILADSTYGEEPLPV